MAKNFVARGDVISIAGAAHGGVSSGDVVEVGSIVGVATNTASSSEVCEVAVTGIWNLPCNTGDGIAVGDLVYANGSGEATTTSTNNPVLGVAVTAQTNDFAHIRLGNVTAPGD